MKSIAVARRVKVSADGRGVVSHAGMGLLRELADLTGLSAQVTAVLADTYRGPWTHSAGAVFADLAAAVADGADCIDGVGQLCADREHLFGAKASTTTMWRLVDQRIDAAHLPGVRAARAAARAAAWAAGAAPRADRPLYIDVDATLVIDHSDNKQDAAPTWKKSFGHHPLLAFLDRPEIAGGEALAGLLRRGNAGSNTAADHITVLDQALASLPAPWRPDPNDPGAPTVVVRSDSAGATHRFAQACRDRGVLAAADLVAWAQLIGFTHASELARCEIHAFRYRVLHVAARITRGARQLRLRIDATWRRATAIETAWQRLRAAFP